MNASVISLKLLNSHGEQLSLGRLLFVVILSCPGEGMQNKCVCYAHSQSPMAHVLP